MNHDNMFYHKAKGKILNQKITAMTNDKYKEQQRDSGLSWRTKYLAAIEVAKYNLLQI